MSINLQRAGPARWLSAGLVTGLVAAMLALAGVPARAAGPAEAETTALRTLEARLQLFRDGALRGFAVAEWPENGVDATTEADFRDLAATGANVVRVAISVRKCEGCLRYDAPEAALRYVERILGWGERLGFRVIVTLMPTPGFSRSDYWDQPALQADLVRQWGQVAQRLRRYPALLAYDLINEPVVPAALAAQRPLAAWRAEWHALATAMARTLRQADPATPVMVEPMPWGLPGGLRDTQPIDVAGLVYSFHLYTPHEFTHQGLPRYDQPRVYPGEGWDRQRLSASIEAARQFAARHRVPMFIGEFSCVRWAPAGSCPRYLADAIALFEAERWGWAYHCWRCYQGWDPEIPPELPQAQRSGRLPEHRRSDTPTLRLLTEAMARNVPQPRR